MSTEDEVRAASAKFYAALNSMANGNAGPMIDIWSHSNAVTTMHPIGNRELGWEQVRGSWEQFAKIATDARVQLDDQLLRVADDMAYELGIERGHLTIAGHEVHTINDRVTNIYRREAGGWKIVHHHTDISQAMIKILQGLQAKT